MKAISQFILISLIGIFISNNTLAQNVNFTKQLTINKSELQLNGHGVRRKYLINLYSLGLYLTEKNNNNEKGSQIANSNANMNIRLIVESKFLSKEKLQDAVTKEFKKQAGDKYKSHKDQLDKFLFCFNGGVKKGDTFDFNFVDSYTLVIFKNKAQVQKITGLEFKQFFYKIWLGSKPIDNDLKQNLV